ncbi:hypothetical protein J2Y46_002608 [Microbacterium sp. BE35]|uniref:hypothetical protein n=1 Tax=Microbacterium sp. BE35 TaxID=2817773 RepID=UPI00285D9295|nr:hypothetical protein [Microbacterium sp. BE35]MDR7189782.1 hypothetical protein [Microbacterium sp. BE35]
MTDVKALIAKARAKAETAPPTVVPVEVGGELVDIAFGRIPGHVWADLTAMCPPRKGSTQDENVGFNADRIVRVYPLESVVVGGEPLLDDEGEFDRETWGALIDELTSPNLKLIAAALWAVNQKAPADLLASLGKARMSAPKRKRTSHAN